MATGIQQQQRWGYWPQQPYPNPPPPPPPPTLQGWQQQSKWRRPLQQQISFTNPPVNVQLLTAQIVLTAYPPAIIVGGVGWQQQSKWRRKTQQLPISFAAPASPLVTVSLLTAQLTLAAYPVTPIVTVAPQGQLPQWRWGPSGPQTIQPSIRVPPTTLVQLAVARITLTALPVVPTGVAPAGWQQQSKWRRKIQQQRSQALLPPLGSGAPGFIRITYPTITGQLLYSISGAIGVDSYGNALAVGYQGPISALQPRVSTPVATETWHALSLVSAQAAASGNGVNGFWYIYRSNNEVELLWDITATNTGGAYIGVMPAGYIPLVQQNFASGWYGTGPTNYDKNFQPHLNVNGIHDPVPGAIFTYGGEVQPLNFFGRAKYLLVAA